MCFCRINCLCPIHLWASLADAAVRAMHERNFTRRLTIKIMLSYNINVPTYNKYIHRRRR